MAGDGPLREMISEQIIAYQLQNSLQLIGVVDVSEELSQCDILVLPSRIDGRPNIVMESLSMGIPVIASNVGDLSGIIADGGTGFLCNPEDIGAFVNRITVLIENNSLREQMKRNAREEAERKMGIQNMFESYAETFTGLVNDLPKP